MLKQVQHDIKKAAFTLAEVLITLTIIGVVAAVTMPTLVQQKNNNEIKAKVKKSYATLSNAFELAKAQNGDFESWDWASLSEDPNKILDIVAPHLNIKEKCGTDDGCFPNVTYKYLNNESDNNYYYSSSIAKAKLSDGSSLAISPNYSCADDAPYLCGGIYIDINGENEPNQWGHDLFEFELTKQGVRPYSKDDVPFGRCEDKGSFYGYGCASKIIYEDDISYLTKTPEMCYGAKGEEVPCSD